MRSFLFIFFLLASACGGKSYDTKVNSPDAKNEISFSINEQGALFYSISHKGKQVIKPSVLGFQLKKYSLKDGFEVVKTTQEEDNSKWKTIWGERETVQDHYRQVTIKLRQKKTGILLNISGRAYNDGVAFRYEFPSQEKLNKFTIMDELTSFDFAGDYKAWWNFADYDNYEKVYYHSPISQIGDTVNFERRVGKEERADMCNTPLTMEIADDLLISIHEANLVDYAGMNLLNTHDGIKLKAKLTPWRNGDLVRTKAPMHTPWRTIQIAEKAGDLIESTMILNLNPPSAIKNSDWIHTSKYIGLWWEMHTGRSSWAEKRQFGKKLPASRPHGATTKNAKYYIDFAAKHGIKDVLIEGWTKGWDDMEPDWKGYGIFDWETPATDFDLDEVTKYAAGKGVRMMAYHETISDVDHYEPKMDQLYRDAYNKGIRVIKVGYTGDVNYNSTVPGSYAQHHHGQYMVRHYRKMIQTAAKNKIMIINHEPIKFTGEQRTYPNLLAREGVRGGEYNAWSKGNSPEHGVILPFTRILGGPIDYTVGYFEVMLPEISWAKFEPRIRSTVAKQLAYFITMYSPIPMAADLPKFYERDLEAFQFIKDVATNWSESKVLHAKIGDYLTMVRKERGTNDWYLGSITDENARNLTINLDFLTKGIKYQATIYADGENNDWKTKPYKVDVIKKEVTAADQLNIKLAAGGGQAIQFKAIENAK
ncbi:glycoside hydrolase family 97 protein [Persicobacter psychrovividus]|uniref:Alpha-glucosidase n=1 Tax=Persicobacter psychrovividus TaxID=387638 RepID=A0ABM7VMU7_9BACT|nr:alpha-glucosidase [Persicobacter psychrovividus]